MSAFRSITMQTATFRTAAPAIRRAGFTRSFQTGRVSMTVKESREGNEERAQEIEHHKQQQLKGQKEGKNEWQEPLASESESALKAEKEDKSIDQMQKEGANAAKKEKK